MFRELFGFLFGGTEIWKQDLVEVYDDIIATSHFALKTSEGLMLCGTHILAGEFRGHVSPEVIRDEFESYGDDESHCSECLEVVLDSAPGEDYEERYAREPQNEDFPPDADDGYKY